MIEASVQQMSEAFKERWNHYLRISPLLVLDETWPTFGVMDLITFGLRLTPEIPESMNNIIRGAAAYLGVMVHRCWSRLLKEVDLRDGPQGIYLEGRGSEWLPEGELLSLQLEDALRKVLREIPPAFPVFYGFGRNVDLESNVFGLMGLGMLTGLGPMVKGPWREKEPEALREVLDQAVRELARQSAENYARAFPDEPLGQLAEIYLNALIYPPLFMNEALPGASAVEQLLEYFTELKIKPQSISAFAANLAQSPDEVFSAVGLAFYAALTDSLPAAEIIASARTKGNFMGLLRPVVLQIRESLKLGDDWLLGSIKNFQLEKRFEIEQAMGLIPWLYLDKERIKNDSGENKLAPLLIAIAEFDLEGAIKAADFILGEEPGDIPLRVQRIKLEILNGDMEKAEKMLRSLFSEPDSDRNPRFFNLWGLCLLQKGDKDNARKYFKAGLAVASAEPQMEAEIANNLAWSCMLTGDPETALENIELGLQKSECPVTLLLNKVSILWAGKQFEEAQKERRRLFKLAPTDRRVFGGLSSLAPPSKGVR